MADALSPDLCVIGGGPGGIAAALAAASARKSVVLVERGAMGGADLAAGSVPAGALAAAARIHEALRQGPNLGVTGAPLQVNLGKVREHIEAATATAALACSAERLTAFGVTVLAGSARFADQQTVTVGEQAIRAKRFVIATGAVPVMPPIPGLDTVEAMTPSDGAFDLARKPAHLVVLGAGGYALQLAQSYNRLGIDATVVSESPALEGEDPELAAVLLDRLRAEGIRVRAGVRVVSAARRKGGVRFVVSDPAEAEGGEISVDGSHVLVVGARKPDVEGLNLAAAGVAWNDTGIVVDRTLRTANRNVYAIGDAIAGPASAARARYQGAQVARSGGLSPSGGVDAVPRVTLTDPALAAVGLAEAEARQRHGKVLTLRFPLAATVGAAIAGRHDGHIKVVTSPGGRILGAAIVGCDAGELIAPWALAVANHLALADMAELVMPTPLAGGLGADVAALPEAAGLTSALPRRIMAALRRLG